jgi:hypothetical protein
MDESEEGAQWLSRLMHWADDSGADTLRSAASVVASGRMNVKDCAAICSSPGMSMPGTFKNGLPVIGSAAHSVEIEASRQGAEALLREAAVAEEDALRRVIVEGRRRLEMLRKHRDAPVRVQHASFTQGVAQETGPFKATSLPVI